jgi:hypothetical protein
LLFSSLYSNTEYYPNSLNFNATPSFSAFNTLNKVLYTPKFEISNWDYTSSTLLDLLSKREHFYRSLFASKAQVIGLPDSLSSTPNNKLLLELRASLGFANVNDMTPAYASTKFDKLGNSFNGLNGNQLDQFQHYLASATPLNLNPVINFTKFYLGGLKNTFYEDTQTAPQLLKSQYRPMRKGVSNMVRLQATSAIAMPTEMRLHILASSKDVIHS